MKAKEFGSWASNKMAPGGLRKPNDEFNRSLKGQPYRRYEEYADRNMEEYHRYPGMKDLTAEEEEKKQSQEQSSQEQSRGKSARNAKGRRSTRATTRNLVSRFVAISVGVVVLANTNPVLAEHLPFLQLSIFDDFREEQKPEPTTPAGPVDPAPTVSATWAWSDDHATATLKLFDGKGTLIAEVPAAVNVEEEQKCTTEGTRTYTATAENDGKTYSDTQNEILPPSGHTFDAGKEVTLANGKTAMVFECEQCHEQVTISTSIEEID